MAEKKEKTEKKSIDKLKKKKVDGKKVKGGGISTFGSGRPGGGG